MTDDDEVEFSDESTGHPLVATIIGAVLLLISATNSRQMRIDSAAEAWGILLGGAIVGAIVWGICYAITIRRSSRGWKIASLVVLLLFGLLASFIQLGSKISAQREDQEAAADQIEDLLNAQDPLAVEIKAGKGGVSQVLATTLKAISDDAKAYESESEAAGLTQVVSFEGLTKSSPVLRNCGALDALKDRADHLGGRFPSYIATARSAGEAAAARGEIARGDVDAFIEGMSNGKARYERQWQLTSETAAEAAALCRVLAHGNWSKPGDAVLFDSQRDLGEAQVHQGRIEALGTEIERLRGIARDNAARQVEEIRR